MRVHAIPWQERAQVTGRGLNANTRETLVVGGLQLAVSLLHARSHLWTVLGPEQIYNKKWESANN